MNLADPGLLELLIAGVAGGGIGQILTWLRGRHTDATAITAQLYEVWAAETTRFTEQIDRLQGLVGALESEIIALGGDPNRIRATAAQAHAQAAAQRRGRRLRRRQPGQEPTE